MKITFEEPQISENIDVEVDLKLSDPAARRIETLMKAEPEGTDYLRVSVLSGGCNGYSYSFKFEDTKGPTDIEIINGNATLLVDAISYELIKGSEIDFIETLEASQFVINNPNATTSCGCGNSFGV